MPTAHHAGSFIRPPGTVVPGRPYVLLLFLYYFYFFLNARSSRSVADLREILPHIRKHVHFINAGPKVWGSAPQKIGGGEKHAKFGPISDTFPL